MAFIDYYKILGVDRNIPQKDVRAAYRKRAKQFHPDLHPNDPKAKAKFQALSEAFEVIGDPDKRAKYDKYGEQWRNADAYEQAGGFGGFNGAQGDGGAFSGFDFSSFGSGGGGFSSFFQDLFGGAGRRRSSAGSTGRAYGRPSPGQMEATVGIDLYHYFDESLVNHVHLSLTIAICEVHLLATNESRHVNHVLWNCPVKSYVSERCLSTPS